MKWAVELRVLEFGRTIARVRPATASDADGCVMLDSGEIWTRLFADKKSAWDYCNNYRTLKKRSV